MLEYCCPECGFVIPVRKTQVSDSSFEPEDGYTYTEDQCPECGTVLLVAREEQ